MSDQDALNLPENFHLGIIMDGNGRWGQSRGLSRAEGHEAGMKRVDELFEAAIQLKICYLTLYAFSNANWKRSEFEVSALMKIFRKYIFRESERFLEQNVRARFIGDKSAFPSDLIEAMLELEEKSAKNDGLYLQVAMNYGGRDEIVRAANRALEAGAKKITIENIEANLDVPDTPPVDLIIRTSGEERISDFLIWQGAYSELYFTDTLWPDFGPSELETALRDFSNRNRRFGGNAK